ncbi:hypothetical protein PENTCL1PPCAC_16662, partial [Pristionchus entomophagus]
SPPPLIRKTHHLLPSSTSPIWLRPSRRKRRRSHRRNRVQSLHPMPLATFLPHPSSSDLECSLTIWHFPSCRPHIDPINRPIHILPGANRGNARSNCPEKELIYKYCQRHFTKVGSHTIC